MIPQTKPDLIPSLIPATLPDDGVQVLRMLITNPGVTPSLAVSAIFVGAVVCFPSSVGEGWVEWNSAVGGLTVGVVPWIGVIPNGTYAFSIWDEAEVHLWEDDVIIRGSVLDPPEVTLV